MSNILVIGDLHLPFDRDGYLDHCKNVKRKYRCNKVVFIGDIIDNHFSSYHETIPDGLGAGEELNQAIQKLKRWYKAFPNATVTIGNHDLIVQRKAVTAGLSKKWLKKFQDVLNVPNWKFVEETVIDDVRYLHGTGTSGANSAWKRMLNLGQSVVMGHVHTESSIRWNATHKTLTFALLTGCGVDEKSYAMEYGKVFPKKMIVSCAVVIDGKLPIIIPMKL